jgi:hypothetical protein
MANGVDVDCDTHLEPPYFSFSDHLSLNVDRRNLVSVLQIWEGILWYRLNACVLWSKYVADYLGMYHRAGVGLQADH